MIFNHIDRVMAMPVTDLALGLQDRQPLLETLRPGAVIARANEAKRSTVTVFTQERIFPSTRDNMNLLFRIIRIFFSVGLAE